ncbi:MAG: ribonuclease R [Xanthomonadales bacterium]|nr:ribonuclease R [Xanthomonadales bacterium]
MSKKKKQKQRSRSPRGGRIDAQAPERNAILELMEERGHPLSGQDIAGALKVKSDGAREILRRRLGAMVRDGQLIRNRRNAYGLAKKMDLVSGYVSAHSDGFGFVVPDEGGDDLYLSPRQMQRVMNGDRVLASVVGHDHRGRKEGAIREVLERAHEEIVGRFIEESGIGMVVPDNPKLNHDVLIPPGDSQGARPGQVVVAQLVTQPTDRKPPVGKIIEILGRAGAPGMATEIAIRDFGLPHEWPRDVERQARAFGDSVPEDMKQGRMDLRKLPLVTIDGADARDFDDAVYANRTRNGWRLIVAIADVASYVEPGTELDREAVDRATSVYFPNRVIPMLPEELSNGLCSLKPREDRLCLACDMTINEQGKVTRSRFAAAVMHSHARLTYDQVWEYIESGNLRHPTKDKAVRQNLDDLHGLYGVLKAARRKRGAIDFESQEVVFRFDRNGTVSELANAERNDAHKLIEECMITANVEAAQLLEKQNIPAPFRVHPPPPDEKLESLTRFLQSQGLKVAWKDKPAPADFDAIAQAARGRPDEKLIMAVLLRAQSLAAYKIENDGHFGLALGAYSHFTSPIRRYPDLLVHRAIHHFLARGKPADFPYSINEMKRLSEHCSQRSRRAEEAERDVADRLKCIFMERHVGDEFEGIVSGVTSFGLFVELDLGNVNGLVHVTGLPNDYYHFNPDTHSMTGERRGRVFRLADRLRVRVTSVNVSDRKVDFELAGE